MSPLEAIYRPLSDNRTIRLIELLPGVPSDVVRTRLLTVPLQDTPPYFAISYVWGDIDRESVNIECNGHVIGITQNLHWALRRVRLPSTVRMLWADAICINQNDLIERSTQISFMGDIYAGARQVLVCIGEPPTVGDDVAVGMLVQCVASSDVMSKNLTAEENDLLASQFSHWKALASLMSSLWFSRAWVIQEVGMSQQSVVLYGQHDFLYADLIQVASWASQQPSLLQFGIPSLRIHVEWRDWTASGSSDNMMSMASPPKTFYDLVDHASLLSCRDPRDHVYAFLGHPLARRGDGGGLLVKPDYRKQDAEVFLEFMVASLDTVGLRALVTVENTQQTLADDFPSWINRWNIPGTWNKISQLPEQVFMAGGPASLGHRPSISGHRLELFGSDVDAVWRCFHFQSLNFFTVRSQNSSVVDDTGRAFDIYQLAQIILGNDFPCSYGNDRDLRLRAFSVALAAAPPQGSPDGMLFALLCVLGGSSDLTRNYSNEVKEEAAKTYWNRVASLLIGRKFAISERGRYCLVPTLSRPGDRICVVYGLDVPLVMRTAHGRLQLLGEAYVGGIMNGEAIEMVRSGHLTQEHFVVT
ncbi:heterokaryon incompatibility protein-domain-containing protein [Stachybotrys elegans]|uniref:Heterokaryon incompatibility protein-domain-containing protein n=1 Tax=Stachybotrys elegans TaxID=80388 RepID=A0A8K0WQI5_9HYPO|nr:heterokaryon incompatibility protein-domain-containing protein [Stachybotrys elegans]